MVETGTLLQNRFLIEEQIGRGGMGAVYVAIDQKFGSRVAIKERAYEDAELAEAFEREARLLNTLHHPILPHVSDYFSENGRYFLVMEYIEGEDLSEVLKREGAFPVEEVMRWSLELLDGLDYLHSQDPPIIHRDIKPHNLKLTSRGNVVLLDFGLAKETPGGTQGGRSVFGYSRRFSPLEQIEGVGTDPRSDIFSLGATIYDLLTGSPPVDVLARASSIVAGKGDPLQPASDLNEKVPPTIASVINSALALNADKRFVSANAMRSALEFAINTDPQEEHVPAQAAVGPPAAAFPVEQEFQESIATAEKAKPLIAEPNNAPAEHHSNVRGRPSGSFGVPVWPSIYRTIYRSDIHRWFRPALWTAAAAACLLLLSYAIYHHSRQTAAMSGENVVEQPSPIQPANETGPAASSEVTIPEQAAVEKPESSEPPQVKPKQSKVKAEAPTVAETREPNTFDDVEDAQPQPRRPKPEPRGRRRAILVGEWQGSPLQRVSRPRVVQTEQFRQPAISTIETILTGLSYDRPRGSGRRRDHDR